VLARALERGGLSAADVQVVPVPLAEHDTALGAGRVDALVTFEPHRGRLLAMGARRLFDSSQIPGEIVDLLLTRRHLDPAQERALATLVDGWFRALEHLRAHPQDAAARMAVRERVAPDQFLRSLDGLALGDRATNLRLLRSELDPALRTLSTTMVRARLLPAEIAPPALDDGPVRRAAP
jgi:NitT/TauT family transport system substrate-binding protein